MTPQPPSIPSATYRLQFHQGFTLRDATQLIPYLDALGISHIYASPIFLASPGSTHGYDIRDHNALNPEIGTGADFDHFTSALRLRKIGLILDFVPNHVGIEHGGNRDWMDVLEHGPASLRAHFFDINWHPVKAELKNKVLLPILGQQYGRALESGELRLEFESGCFFVRYFQTRLPIALATVLTILEQALHRLPPTLDETDRLEIESIITAIRHLPDRTETDPAKKAELARESLVIKTRLRKLCDRDSVVCNSIKAAVDTWQVNPQDPLSFDALDQLLAAQSYRLSFWRVAGEEINYRRFFDINTLAAIRMELPEVFEATHHLVSEWMAQGIISGLRIDHIDGLRDPREYCVRLQNRFAACFGLNPETQPLYLLVEKILLGTEELHRDWPVHGTTGYEFANQATGLLTHSAAERAMTKAYLEFIGGPVRWEDIVYLSKLLITRVSMASEINVLGHRLNHLSETNRRHRDFTLNALTSAIREVIAAFPVYRTYLRPDEPPSPEDSLLIQHAIRVARRRNPAIERSIFEFLRDVILLPTEENRLSVAESDRQDFVLTFQQITGPVMAKGVEDTASYLFNRLVALNEVGGEPDQFGISPERFHALSVARQKTFPHSLLASTTHDTKRSEDVRARLAVLSEMPEQWRKSVRRWQTANRGHKTVVDGRPAPDPNEEYLLYQTLVGSWPLEPFEGAVRDEYVQRIQAYMIKALREAKANSSWIEANEAWENATTKFVEALLRGDKNRFLPLFTPFAQEVARLGVINSLSQTLLKCTVPGVPDVYQGTELWDLSLVDPDNRRPVDFDRRKSMLESLPEPPDCSELLRNWSDSRVKLFVLSRLLRYRRKHFDLFAQGSYSPLETAGTHAPSCLAFCRTHNEGTVMVVAPRLTRAVGFPPIGSAWKDTRLLTCNSTGTWKELFTGRQVSVSGEILLSDLLESFPLALLEKQTGNESGSESEPKGEKVISPR